MSTFVKDAMTAHVIWVEQQAAVSGGLPRG